MADPEALVGDPKRLKIVAADLGLEAFVGDRWYTFDARHNEPRIDAPGTSNTDPR